MITSLYNRLCTMGGGGGGGVGSGAAGAGSALGG